MLLCIREDISSPLLNSDILIEGFFVELNLTKKKWLLCCSYKPHKNQIPNSRKEIGSNIDVFSSNYDNLVLLGDFNVEATEQPMKDFCLIYNCKNIMREKTCYKNLETPCTDPIMTNIPKSFEISKKISK